LIGSAWLSSVNPNPWLGSAQLINRTGSGRLGSGSARLPGPLQHYPWRYLEDNEQISDELLTAKYLDQEYITNLQILQGTGQYEGKEVKYSTTRNCWIYLNNRAVHFHGTSASETPDSPADNDTARVEEILERTDTIVSSAIQKLQSISRPASPVVQTGTSRTATKASSLPTPPVSKGKAPAPVPPRTRTPTFRSSASQASTSQRPVQAPPPQPAAPQLPPSNSTIAKFTSLPQIKHCRCNGSLKRGYCRGLRPRHPTSRGDHTRNPQVHPTQP